MQASTYDTSRKKNTTSQLVWGFTLVELMVSVSIFAVISAVVFANYGRFNSNIALTNLAYDIALSVRKAQSFGLNTRANEGLFEDTRGNVLGYGIYFESNKPAQYRIYTDLSGNNGINTGEVIEDFKIQKRNIISNICVNVVSGPSPSRYCSDSLRERIAFYALYRRPNPEPIMFSNKGTIDSATITVSAPNGNSRDILITASGQISVVRP